MKRKGKVFGRSATGGMKELKREQVAALDPLALKILGQVAGLGAQKYATFNFAKGYPWTWSANALLRHLLSFLNGEDVDPESGYLHLAHAMWHCHTLLCFQMRRRGTDDRFPQVVEKVRKGGRRG